MHLQIFNIKSKQPSRNNCILSISTKKNYCTAFKVYTWLRASYRLSYKFSRFSRITVLPVSIQTLIRLMFLHTCNMINQRLSDACITFLFLRIFYIKAQFVAILVFTTLVNLGNEMRNIFLVQLFLRIFYLKAYQKLLCPVMAIQDGGSK